jgi:hypothetical protein
MSIRNTHTLRLRVDVDDTLVGIAINYARLQCVLKATTLATMDALRGSYGPDVDQHHKASEPKPELCEAKYCAHSPLF